MALGRLWAGKAYGTNIGNLFIELTGNDNTLAGTLKFNEIGVGVGTYSIAGSFDGSRLELTGTPQTDIEGVEFGSLSASGTLNSKGDLEGRWETNVGTAGTFILFPHDRASESDSLEPIPDQLHTARHHFGAIVIDREQIIALADDIQREFTRGTVVVTVAAGTEQARFLGAFKDLTFAQNTAEWIRIFVQEPDGGGLNKVVTVEFGQQLNFVSTQSGNEAWVLGKLETLKRDLRKYERSYTTHFKRIGFGVNQIMLVAALIYLPSLPNLQNRASLFLGVLTIAALVNWLHHKYLPFSAIYLNNRSDPLLTRIWPSLASWLISATAGIAATLLAAYLQGVFSPAKLVNTKAETTKVVAVPKQPTIK